MAHPAFLFILSSTTACTSFPHSNTQRARNSNNNNDSQLYTILYFHTSLLPTYQPPQRSCFMNRTGRKKLQNFIAILNTADSGSAPTFLFVVNIYSFIVRKIERAFFETEKSTNWESLGVLE